MVKLLIRQLEQPSVQIKNIIIAVSTDFIADKANLPVILGPVHTTQEKFENGGFTLKTHQMFSARFSVHTTPEELKKTKQSPVILDLCSNDYRDVFVSEKNFFSKALSVHTKTKSRCF